MMYKVQEIASICSVSVSSVYKEIQRFQRELEQNPTLSNAVLDLSTGRKLVTEEGLAYFRNRFGLSSPEDVPPAQDAPPPNTPPPDSSPSVVAALQQQIADLKEQLAAKDAQIQNLHVLLRLHVDKVPQLAPPKQPWWRRLFGGRAAEQQPEEPRP